MVCRVPSDARTTKTNSTGIVPADAPAWITPELITSPLETWQPYYEAPLTPDDACAMILGVSQLLAVLSRGTHRETVRRVGTGQQSGTGA